MREQREPWLKLPDNGVGGQGDQSLDPRFRTHVIMTAAGGPALPRIAPTEPPEPRPVAAPRPTHQPAPPKPVAVPVPRDRPAPGAAARPVPAAASASPRIAGKRPLGAPPLGLSDLPVASSADWVAKVGEASKLVDVIVVFYTAAHVTSDVFQLAFQTVINEVLPQIGRPYAAYRFALDAEPSSVAEIAERLGLPRDDPITVAGFAWSGPGRRLFLIGDRALASRPAFFRFLRQGLIAQQPPVTRGRGPGAWDVAGFERAHERARRRSVRLWGGRALAILAWCLFGTAALGAAVVGVAPQWARSLLHPAAFSGTAPVPKAPLAAPHGAGRLTSAVPAVARLDRAPVDGNRRPRS